MEDEMETVSIPTAEEAIQGLIARLVAEKNKLKAEIERLQTGRDMAFELMTRFFIDRGREMVCKGCLQGSPRRSTIAHKKACFVGDLEAALRGAPAESAEDSDADDER